MAILTVKNLTKTFGALVANNDVSFDVERGSIVGLIGPNGAGKTTLFNCVAGMYRPTSGRVFFEDRDITNLPSWRIARLGVARTFQVVRPLREMTVMENILVGAYMRTGNPEEAASIAERCLDMSLLSPYKNRRAGGLTIGNKKRLEVARALATGPRLILLDEAAAGLTSSETREMVELIQRMKDDGITVLMVEHIMEAIMPIADKLVVLNGGEKISEDAPEAVVKDPEVIRAYFGEKYSKRLQRDSKGVDSDGRDARG
ncbi:MAG: ABC transporter ATP-binding protein [Synergistaceae bacterium]|nr:ABC transporter ATP-binding protein [Synergistota bacterium]NLM71233.1 ABC transporter ATP-binding protein [Synergistaceae bacterium]